MKHVSKILFTTLTLATLVGTAAAQDAVEGEAPAEGEAAAETTGEAAPAEAAPAAADSAKKMTVGADAAFVLPFGDYADTADFGLGILGRFEFAVSPELAITGRLGYVFHTGTPDGVSVSFIPVMAGAAYKIGTSGLFAYGELGLNYITVSVDFMGQSASDSETKLSLGAGVGYQMDKLKARVGFWMPGSVGGDNGTDSTTLTGVMANVGYDFASF